MEAQMFKRQITLALSVSMVSLGVAFGAGVAGAQTAKGLVDPLLFEAYADYVSEPGQSCVAPNGAQIMGNFVGGHELIDARTGEICS
jgi:hypothetical protein